MPHVPTDRIVPDPARLAELRETNPYMTGWGVERQATGEALHAALDAAATLDDIRPILRTLIFNLFPVSTAEELARAAASFAAPNPTPPPSKRDRRLAEKAKENTPPEDAVP